VYISVIILALWLAFPPTNQPTKQQQQQQQQSRLSSHCPEMSGGWQPAQDDEEQYEHTSLLIHKVFG